MAENDPNGSAWRRDQWTDHELPAISSARNSAWASRELQPDQNLPSRGVSVLLVVIAAIESVLTSGIVFGWAPLQLLLQEEGIYGDSCPEGPPCEAQAVRMPTEISHQMAIIYKENRYRTILQYACPRRIEISHRIAH